MWTERAVLAQRRVRRARLRGGFLAMGVALLMGFVVWSALGGPDRPSADRPFGAGLPPAEVPRSMADGIASRPDAAVTARRAEIAAEEARLAVLRAARLRLEQEVAALEQEAVERRRAPEPAVAAPASPAATPILAQPPAPDPSARPVRVVVRHRANSPGASAAASEVAQSLRGGGFEVQGLRGAPFVPSTPVVRYFHEEDQGAAAQLAGRLGRGWAIQDFRAYLPKPAPQTLEVWLAAE